MSRSALSALALLALLLPVLFGAAPAQESEPESFLPYLFAAYTVLWVGFIAYAFFISRKQGDLKREIAALRQALGEREARQQGEPPARP